MLAFDSCRYSSSMVNPSTAPSTSNRSHPFRTDEFLFVGDLPGVKWSDDLDTSSAIAGNRPKDDLSFLSTIWCNYGEILRRTDSSSEMLRVSVEYWQLDFPFP